MLSAKALEVKPQEPPKLLMERTLAAEGEVPQLTPQTPSP